MFAIKEKFLISNAKKRKEKRKVVFLVFNVASLFLLNERGVRSGWTQNDEGRLAAAA